MFFSPLIPQNNSPKLFFKDSQQENSAILCKLQKETLKERTKIITTHTYVQEQDGLLRSVSWADKTTSLELKSGAEKLESVAQDVEH